MNLLNVVVLALTSVSFALGATPRNGQNCTKPDTRVEWRALQPSVQQSYIDAVLCLKTRSSRIGLTTSLFDDFSYVHHRYNSSIHGVAAFLPWHRYFVHVYEGALRECGYMGAATYWDWTLDVRRFSTSPVMSTALGFGYDGSDAVTQELSTGETIRCVTDGPFSELRPSYIAPYTGPQLIAEEHCLWRRIIDGNSSTAAILSEHYNSTYVEMIEASTMFSTFAPMLEQGPHGNIHISIGGDMIPTTSPNEPLFFLHHGQIDRLWWIWQNEDLKKREFDFSGSAVSSNSGEVMNATLFDLLSMGGLAEDMAVHDIMSTNEYLCYQYGK